MGKRRTGTTPRTSHGKLSVKANQRCGNQHTCKTKASNQIFSHDKKTKLHLFFSQKFYTSEKPHPMDGVFTQVVAGAGFEPTTSGL